MTEPGSQSENEEKTEQDKRETSRLRQLYALGFAATEFGVVTAVGILVGSYLDRWIGVAPLFTFLGLIAGFVIGLKVLIGLTRRVNKKG